MHQKREWALKQAMSMMIVYGRRSTKSGLLGPDRETYIELSKILREEIKANGEYWPATKHFPCPDGQKITDINVEQRKVF